MTRINLGVFRSTVPPGSAELVVTNDLDSRFPLTDEDRLIILRKEENKEV
jgi:hypothetical protein